LIVIYLMRLTAKEELKLDFYKKETVQSWLNVLDQVFWLRGGSSITKSLMLEFQDMTVIREILYGHK